MSCCQANKTFKDFILSLLCRSHFAKDFPSAFYIFPSVRASTTILQVCFLIFKICEELRITIPDSMKYFCVSEAVAMYLQKHIVYRKRKVFYGDGTPSSIISLIGPKHKGEKFLIAQSDNASHDLENMLAAAGLETKTAVFIKTVYTDLKAIDMSRYQMIVFYNPSDIKSLFESYPDFKQEGMLFATFGKPTAKAMSEYGLSVEVEAPTPEAPSIARALSLYFASHHDEN